MSVLMVFLDADIWSGLCWVGFISLTAVPQSDRLQITSGLVATMDFRVQILVPYLMFCLEL